MIAAIPLIADAGDVLGVIVFLVILIISAVSQMLGKAKEAQQQRPRPPVRPVRPAPNPQDPVVRELDEFLRRAAAGGKAQAQPRPAAPQQQAAPVRPQAAPARSAPRPAARQQPVVLVARPVPVHEAEALEEIHLEPTLGERLSQAGGPQLSSQTEQPLGAGVAEAQQRMSQQLTQDFDHKVGQLAGGRQAAKAAIPSTAAAGLAALLASPADLRQAILINEILQRPEHRWHR